MGRVALLLGLAGIMAEPVSAQPLERNLPPAPTATQTPIAVPPVPGAANDGRSLGVAVTAIVLLGPTSPVQEGAASDIDARLVGRLRGARAQRALRLFLGKPLSRKLISQVEAAIIREYRRQGFPFVEVSTPEQEISGGVLQIRVIEFRVGKVAVTGAAKQASAIARQVRTRSGDEISAPMLAQDLDWLNRMPDRTVSPSFTPAAALGQTNLDLAVVKTKPWTLSGGFTNSGSPATGDDRYFLGASLAGHWPTDELLSMQVTGSPDFWAAGGLPFSQPHPLYESAAGRLLMMTGPRQDIEATIDAVETNEPISPFVVRQQTLEATLAYRGALSNLVALPGDVSAGVEASRQARRTFFGGVEVLTTSVDVFQLFGDWSDHWTDRLGASSTDISVHGSPGAIDDRNRSDAFSTFTNGRVTGASYVYGAVEITRQTNLGAYLHLTNTFSGQYADAPLPDSQQLALGGQSAVRGYSLDDGAWDDGAFLRDDLGSSLLPLVRRGPVPVYVSPRLFVDAGYGWDRGVPGETWMASAGLGADIRLGAHAVAALDLGWPLLDAKVTRAGDTHLDARVSLAY